MTIESVRAKDRPSAVARIALQLCAPVFVRDAYRSILGREPDGDGYAAYSRELRTRGRLAEVLSDLLTSKEANDLALARLSPDFVRYVYLGLLDRRPNAEELAAGCDNLTGTVARLSYSLEFIDKVIERSAEELIVAGCRRLLPADLEGDIQRTLVEQLTRSKDLATSISTIALYGPSKIWLNVKAEEITRAAYHGLLNKEPHLREVAADAAELRNHGNLAEFFSRFQDTRLTWEETVQRHADRLVGAAYRGLLKRDPDEAGLAAYKTQLAGEDGLTGVIARLADSDERRALVGSGQSGQSELTRRGSVAALASDLVRSAFRGLLDRDPDPGALTRYSNQIRECGEISRTLHEIVRSKEFQEKSAALRTGPDPADTYQDPAWVFLHIQKTAGTSLFGMLWEAFQGEGVYTAVNDQLHLQTPAELSKYSLFTGHFNHDSLRYIPRQSLLAFTFVREPRKRLLSLYYYWRSHEPSHPDYGHGPSWANELALADFFGSEEVVREFGLWNHMAWAIMGQRRWRAWRSLLVSLTSGDCLEVLEATVRPAVRERLREFLFVGLQEDFARSVFMLFNLLDRPQPAIKERNVTGQLGKIDRHFKTYLAKEAVSGDTARALDALTQIDQIIYEEAQALLAERSAGMSESTPLCNTGT